jgi:hypothetical protein
MRITNIAGRNTYERWHYYIKINEALATYRSVVIALLIMEIL